MAISSFDSLPMLPSGASRAVRCHKDSRIPTAAYCGTFSARTSLFSFVCCIAVRFTNSPPLSGVCPLPLRIAWPLQQHAEPACGLGCTHMPLNMAHTSLHVLPRCAGDELRLQALGVGSREHRGRLMVAAHMEDSDLQSSRPITYSMQRHECSHTSRSCGLVSAPQPQHLRRLCKHLE